MARANTKNRLLEAAEAIVREQGARHLTLDAVAERCNLSKGGVLYHFPTKVALLQGMLDAYLEGESETFARLTGEAPDETTALELEIQTAFANSVDNTHVSRALIAAVAENPELTSSVQEFLDGKWREAVGKARDRNLAAVLLYSAMGVYLQEVLHYHSPDLLTGDDMPELSDIRELMLHLAAQC